MSGSDSLFFRRLADLKEAGTPCATVQIVRVNGSIPNGLGARMLVSAAGELLMGTVGGGQIEFQALARAAEAIAEGRSRLVACKLTEKEAGGIGMMCGGQADLFIEVHLPDARLVLCGGGHINLALARMAEGLGWRITVIDDRAEWVNAEHYPGAERIVRRPEEVLGTLGLDPRSFVVIGTRDRDTEAIVAASKTAAGYIGVVASKRKAIQIAKHLAHRDDPDFDLEKLLPRFYGPIGLALGGRSPEAVALSILAEVQALRHGESAGPMRVSPNELRRLLEKKATASDDSECPS
jgi:xanthine dehydrogenase accessory factor